MKKWTLYVWTISASGSRYDQSTKDQSRWLAFGGWADIIKKSAHIQILMDFLFFSEQCNKWIIQPVSTQHPITTCATWCSPCHRAPPPHSRACTCSSRSGSTPPPCCRSSTSSLKKHRSCPLVTLTITHRILRRVRGLYNEYARVRTCSSGTGSRNPSLCTPCRYLTPIPNYIFKS